MKQNTKEWVQYMSAVALIASAITLAFVSFFLTEDIGAGPLTYIGEALSAALGIFGVAVYFVNQASQFKTEIRQQLEQMRKEAERETDENKQ